MLLFFLFSFIMLFLVLACTYFVCIGCHVLWHHCVRVWSGPVWCSWDLRDIRQRRGQKVNKQTHMRTSTYRHRYVKTPNRHQTYEFIYHPCFLSNALWSITFQTIYHYNTKKQMKFSKHKHQKINTCMLAVYTRAYIIYIYDKHQAQNCLSCYYLTVVPEVTDSVPNLNS